MQVEQTSQLVADLQRQLPGRGQDQALHGLLLLVDVLDHRNAEGKGLARARRGLDHDVLPLLQRGDALPLHPGGMGEAFFLQRRQYMLGNAQLPEGDLCLIHSNFPSVDTDC